MSFAFQDNWVCCIGDGGTLHIFSVDSGVKEIASVAKKNTKTSSTKNTKSIFGKIGLGAFFNYFDSELNFAHFKNNYDSQTKAIFLSNEDMILLISYKGDCCKLWFDHNCGGECNKKMTTNLLQQKE